MRKCLRVLRLIYFLTSVFTVISDTRNHAEGRSRLSKPSRRERRVNARAEIMSQVGVCNPEAQVGCVPGARNPYINQNPFGARIRSS